MLPLALLLVAAAAGPPLPADLVIEHAKIWTGDPANPEAEAVAVWRGRVVAELEQQWPAETLTAYLDALGPAGTSE